MFFTDFFFYSFSFFQNPATPAAYGIQDLHNFVNLWLVIVFFPILSMLYLIFKEAFYSKKNKNYHITLIEKMYLNTFFHNPKLEVVWTILPAIILIIIAIPSFALLYAIDETIDPVKTVKAIGNQWFWEYEFFSKGKKNAISSYIIPTKDLVKSSIHLLDVDNPLILKSYQYIRILITSNDVLHSWAVPSLGIKLDGVSGRSNQTNLYLLRPGVFYGQYSELCGVDHGFMSIKVISYNFFGFFKYFLDSQINRNLAKPKKYLFDYQILCGFLGTSIALILLILGILICRAGEYNPRLLVIFFFLYTCTISSGLSYSIEIFFSFFLGTPNFLMKLNVGYKFFYIKGLSLLLESCLAFLFYMNWIPDNKEFIWCLVFIAIVCGLYQNFAHIIYSAKWRYSALILDGSQKALNDGSKLLNDIEDIKGQKKFWHLNSILYVLLCYDLRVSYPHLFDEIFDPLGLSFLAQFTFNGLTETLGWPYILNRVFGSIIGLLIAMLYFSNRFLPQKSITTIYRLFPKKCIFFLIKCFDYLLEKRIVLFTYFLARLARSFSLALLIVISANSGDSSFLLLIYIFLFLTMFFSTLGFILNIAKMFYEMPPKALFFLLGVDMPLPSCVDIHGRCTDPRFSFLVHNNKKNRWENRFLGEIYYFNDFAYSYRFKLNWKTIDTFSTIIFIIVLSFAQTMMIVPFW